MKVVFMGTPDFALPALRRLIDEHQVVCVYTREPKPAGRGNKLNKTPIHLLAEQNGIEVRTPKTLRDIEEQHKFTALSADIAVVAAYGLILPLPILQAFPQGCLNIHASLLPRWRGAAPIQRAIAAGDTISGITIMQMAQGLDTGDMLLQAQTPISARTTGGDLHDALSVIGADLISEVLADLTAFKPQKQDENLSCYAAKIDKNECLLDFSLPLDELYNKIRAFNPYPATFFEYSGERFKVLEAEKLALCGTAGEILSADGELIIATGNGALKITQIQRQGKRPMPVSELLRGYSFKTGDIIRQPNLI